MSTRIKVKRYEHTITTRDPSGDAWDNGDTSTEHTICGVSIGTERSWDCFCDVEVKPGDTVYLLYGVYSTGCSFGSNSQSGIEFVKVFKSHAAAESWRKALIELSKQRTHDFQMELVNEAGIPEKYYAGWMFDYFGGMDYIDIDPFILGEAE